MDDYLTVIVGDNHEWAFDLKLFTTGMEGTTRNIPEDLYERYETVRVAWNRVQQEIANFMERREGF